MAKVFTIGHSTRTLDELIDLLRENGVERLADIRRYPGSRRLPHFSKESLEIELPKAGLTYEHFEKLGGRRRPSPDSENGGLHNEQFRAYADHMSSPEFQHELDRLLASPLVTAVMCAEAVPWRCHRNLLSDELLRRGLDVVHIVGPGQTRSHTLHRDAVIEHGRVIYPPQQKTLDLGKL